jgi:hypothetical protein
MFAKFAFRSGNFFGIRSGRNAGGITFDYSGKNRHL